MDWSAGFLLLLAGLALLVIGIYGAVWTRASDRHVRDDFYNRVWPPIPDWFRRRTGPVLILGGIVFLVGAALFGLGHRFG